MRTVRAALCFATSLSALACSSGGDPVEPEQITYIVGSQSRNFVELFASFRGIAVYGEYAGARRVLRHDLVLSDAERAAMAAIRDDMQLREECDGLNDAWRRNREICTGSPRDASTPTADGSGDDNSDAGTTEAGCTTQLDDSRLEYIKAFTSPPSARSFRCPLGLKRSARLEEAVAKMEAILLRARNEGELIKE